MKSWQILALMTTLSGSALLAACGASDNEGAPLPPPANLGGDSGMGGAAPAQPGPGIQAPGERNLATVSGVGDSFVETETKFAGNYEAGATGQQFVSCSFDAEPGEPVRRLRVLVGGVGEEPTAELLIQDRSVAEPFETTYTHSPDSDALFVRMSPAKTTDGTYQYELGSAGPAGPNSVCWVSVSEFTNAKVVGTVACRDLVRTETSLDATALDVAVASATLTFDCLLGSETGGDTEPNMPPPGPECATGATQACVGVEDCAGTQACVGDEWAECVCPPQPSVLLKLLTPSAGYDSVIRQTDGSGLSTQVTSLASSGYVVTAATANTVPYTLWGVRETGSTKKYEAIIRQTDGSGLSSAASSMASSGYVLTAAMANTVPYTLIGVREVGSTKKYEAIMRQTDGSGLSSAVSSMGSSGYVVTAATANTVPYTLFGVREAGSTKTYQAIIEQTDGSGLSTAATSLTSSGYVVTAAMANTVPYTLIGVREVGKTLVLGAKVQQTDGSGLSSASSSMGGLGFAIFAATANTAPYTLFGTSIAP